MANALTGRVLAVRPPQTITSKTGTSFTKRELILDCTRYDPYTGQRGFENTPCIAFMQDKCSLLDQLSVGMIVTVNIDISGRKAKDSDTYFNDVRGYKVEVIRQNVEGQAVPQDTYPQSAPIPPVTQQPIAQYPPQGYAPQQPQYPPQAYAAPQPGYPQPPIPNDPPF